MNFEYYQYLNLIIKYKYYSNSSKSCCNALSMYKGRSMMIILLIGDHRFLFASPKIYTKRKFKKLIEKILQEIMNEK